MPAGQSKVLGPQAPFCSYLAHMKMYEVLHVLASIGTENTNPESYSTMDN